MVTCQSEARERVRSAAGRVLTFPSVVAVDVLEPSSDPTDCWTIDLLVESEGMPPAVAGVLAEYDLTILRAIPECQLWHVIVVAQ